MAGGSRRGHDVAVWGLTFKARTDDLRDSPALEVIAPAAGAGRRRPRPTTRRSHAIARRRSRSCADPYAACEGADVLVVLTEWDEFRWLDLDKVAGVDGATGASSTPATCSTGPP